MDLVAAAVGVGAFFVVAADGDDEGNALVAVVFGVVDVLVGVVAVVEDVLVGVVVVVVLPVAVVAVLLAASVVFVSFAAGLAEVAGAFPFARVVVAVAVVDVGLFPAPAAVVDVLIGAVFDFVVGEADVDVDFFGEVTVVVFFFLSSTCSSSSFSSKLISLLLLLFFLSSSSCCSFCNFCSSATLIWCWLLRESKWVALFACIFIRSSNWLSSITNWLIFAFLFAASVLSIKKEEGSGRITELKGT